MSNTRGVRIWQQLQAHYTNSAVDGFRFTLIATDGNKMPNEIFRYEPLPPGFQCGAQDSTGVQAPQGVQGAQGSQGSQGAQGPQVAEACATFNGVCSAVDLAELPIGAPNTSLTPPYFRLSYVDLLLRTKKEATTAATDIKNDVARLVRSMNENDVLAPATTFWVGDDLPDGALDTLITP